MRYPPVCTARCAFSRRSRVIEPIVCGRRDSAHLSIAAKSRGGIRRDSIQAISRGGSKPAESRYFGFTGGMDYDGWRSLSAMFSDQASRPGDKPFPPGQARRNLAPDHLSQRVMRGGSLDLRSVGYPARGRVQRGRNAEDVRQGRPDRANAGVMPDGEPGRAHAGSGAPPEANHVARQGVTTAGSSIRLLRPRLRRGVSPLQRTVEGPGRQPCGASSR